MRRIPVIDLFAGPGGLGEGFSAYQDLLAHARPFKIALSIEKDAVAHRTLELRSFFRQFAAGDAPQGYYDYLRGDLKEREVLFKNHSLQSSAAQDEAWCAELGKRPHGEVSRRIKNALGDAEKWLLIGGPPCQAYSLVGRSRMKGQPRKLFEADKRHFLYKEYLKILADHRPPVFVMENVKGILSSTVGGRKGQPIFEQIFSDLSSPSEALAGEMGFAKKSEYCLYSLTKNVDCKRLDAGTDYIIRSEKYGIPQARHRVVLLGVRSDIKFAPLPLVEEDADISVSDVINDFPPIRSGLSEMLDSNKSWRTCLLEIRNHNWFQTLKTSNPLLRENIERNLSNISDRVDLGGKFMRTRRKVREYEEWYLDANLNGVACHNSRRHLTDDIRRYFFAACFAKVYKKSPKIIDFPTALWPAHNNVQKAAEGKLFSDRFRVQVARHPSSTVTSHISKDGHYFIHPDPLQARSLSVREAARLQTFPDNYFFEGSVTEQYHQVGNAVPPLLARKIAGVVSALFSKMC